MAVSQLRQCCGSLGRKGQRIMVRARRRGPGVTSLCEIQPSLARHARGYGKIPNISDSRKEMTRCRLRRILHGSSDVSSKTMAQRRKKRVIRRVQGGRGNEGGTLIVELMKKGGKKRGKAGVKRPKPAALDGFSIDVILRRRVGGPRRFPR